MKLDTVVCGDCLDTLATIPDKSVDAVFTDPPYPHIKRDYGYWTSEEWWSLIVDGVVPEVRRILKPTGSAIFILQPNSEKVGKMRGWLFEFQAWVCREWNMVQDVWWWNPVVMPSGLTTIGMLTRQSIKACVWCGSGECYRKQDSVLWTEAESSKMRYARARASGEAELGRIYSPSGHSKNWDMVHESAIKRGGVTPYNLLPFANTNSQSSAGAYGHGAGTPLKLTDWWLRYIVPPGGTVVDPFMGSGTTAVAAIKQRKHFFGCDTVAEYVDIANKRIEKARSEMRQMELPGLEG